MKDNDQHSAPRGRRTPPARDLRVAIVRCESYQPEVLRRSLLEGLDLLGGIDALLHPAQHILLKPNLFAAASPERALTTHPALVRTLCMLLQERGTKASLGDNPVFGFTSLTYRRTGISEALRGTSCRLVDLRRTVPHSVPRGRLLRTVPLPRDISRYDRIVSIPKLKTHQLMGLTGAVKNSYGLVHGRGIRKRFHLLYPDPYDFARMLLDVNDSVDPDLFIVDAVTASDGNGPRWGSPRQVNHLVLGTDAVAVDCVLSKIVGIPLRRIWTLHAAVQERHWEEPFPNIAVLGVPIEEALCRNFVPPPAQGGLVSALPRPLRDALSRYSPSRRGAR